MLLIFYKIFLLTIISRGLSCITASLRLCGRWWSCISLTSSVICWRSRISLTSSVICWRSYFLDLLRYLLEGCISLTSSVICWRVVFPWPPPLFAGGSFLDHFHYFVHFVSFLLLVSFALLVSFVLPASSVPLVSFSSSCFKFFLFLILLAFLFFSFVLLILFWFSVVSGTLVFGEESRFHLLYAAHYLLELHYLAF